MASMYGVGDVAAEIRDMSALLKARADSGRISDGKMEEHMVQSIACKIAGFKIFSAGNAVTLTKVIAECAINEPSKYVLDEAIEARIAGVRAAGAGHHHHNKAVTKPQLLLYPNRLLTVADWTWIRDRRNDVERKLMIIVMRLSRLGVRSLHEQTKRWIIVCILQTIFEEKDSWPSYDDVYSWVGLLVRLMDQCKQPYPLQTILEYPNDPADLPKDVFAYAYDPDDPPTTMEIPHYYKLGDHVPLRNTSSLLTKNSQRCDPLPGRHDPSDIRLTILKQPASSNAINRRLGMIHDGRSEESVQKGRSSDSLALTWDEGTWTDQPHGNNWGDHKWHDSTYGWKTSHESFLSKSPASPASDKHVLANETPQHPAQQISPLPSRLCGFPDEGLDGIAPPAKKAKLGDPRSVETVENDLLEQLKPRKGARADARSKKKEKTGPGALKRPAAAAVLKRPAAAVLDGSAMDSPITPRVQWDPGYKSNKHVWESK